MTTLTADEITDLRTLTGDLASAVEISNAVIQTLYDRAVSYSLDARTTEAVTVVFILERLWGLARVKVDIGASEFEIERRSQYFKNLTEMLKRYESIAIAGGFTGSTTGAIRMGTLSLDLDTTQDNIDDLLAGRI